MKYHQPSLINLSKVLLLPAIALTVLSGCDDSDDDGVGYISFYNASANAPGIYLTVDEDIEEDDDEDEVEVTYASVDYTETSGYNQLDTDKYYVELAWQEDDSTDRDDLAMIYQEQLTVSSDAITFVVLAGDISEPEIYTYNVDVIDDDNDDDDDLFNIRFLNVDNRYNELDLYWSESNETFAQATMLDTLTYSSLTDNVKLEEDSDYVFYITVAGSEEVLYQSNEVAFSTAGQYVMTVRANGGGGSSPFVMDRLSGATSTAYSHDGSDATFRVFNSIISHEDIPEYAGAIDVSMTAFLSEVDINDIGLGEFSESLVVDSGDYAVEVVVAGSDTELMENHLFTLTENANSTIFLYLTESAVDDDNDGDIDENSDGQIDDVEVSINSLMVSNNIGDSIYSHNVQILNFVDSDDFDVVKFYFVQSDEFIDDAEYFKSAAFGSPQTIALRNNSYTIYAIATDDNSSDILLGSQQLTLDEESNALFLLIETDDTESTGYSIKLLEQ